MHAKAAVNHLPAILFDQGPPIGLETPGRTLQRTQAEEATSRSARLYIFRSGLVSYAVFGETTARDRCVRANEGWDLGISTTTGCLESHCKTSASHRYSRSPTHRHSASSLSLSLSLLLNQQVSVWPKGAQMYLYICICTCMRHLLIR